MLHLTLFSISKKILSVMYKLRDSMKVGGQPLFTALLPGIPRWWRSLEITPFIFSKTQRAVKGKRAMQPHRPEYQGGACSLVEPKSPEF